MKQSLRTLDLTADRMDGEVVGVLFFEDERPLNGPAALLDWRMNGLLTRMLLAGEAVGRRNEKILIDPGPKILAPWVLFQGGGRLRDYDPDFWRASVNGLLQTALDAGFSRVALCLTPLCGASPEEVGGLVREELANFRDKNIECLLSVDDLVRRISDEPGRRSFGEGE